MEIFLITMVLIFSVPYLIWRLGRTEYYAPLVVVQIIVGILLGPGVLGAAFPEHYALVFTPAVSHALSGISAWAVMLFVWIAGIELDLGSAWADRRATAITAGLAMAAPLFVGCVAAIFISEHAGWMGDQTRRWQFVLAVGTACAVTALPILVLLLEKLALLRQPLGQRILRYASLDDIAIWGVLALILMDWQRLGRQAMFLSAFALAAFLFRRLMIRLPARDRWYVGLIWLAGCGFSAEWCGLHFMVGAFLAGAVMEARWFDLQQLDWLRRNVLLMLMPVFFLSTGLRTDWSLGGRAVFLVAGVLLLAQLGGKLLGTHVAGRLLHWKSGESMLIGWLLQTKALIMIVFASILLDKHVITSGLFTALLLMAVASTMLTVPMVSPILARMRTPPAGEASKAR
jgi:Kef-type K+ transport system membrane component KefB